MLNKEWPYTSCDDQQALNTHGSFALYNEEFKDCVLRYNTTNVTAPAVFSNIEDIICQQRMLDSIRRPIMNNNPHVINLRGGGSCHSREARREAQLRRILELEAESEAMRDSDLDLAYEIAVRARISDNQERKSDNKDEKTQ